MVVVARNGKEGTRRELVANDFAWRPLPRAFKFTRFRIQPTRKKHTDRVFLSSSCEPLDPACESLDHARLHQSGRSTCIMCFFQSPCKPFDQACEPLDQARLHQSGRSTRIVCFFQVLVSRSIRLVSPLDQASCLKPSMVQFVHEVHPVFVVALSIVM